jgi:hypothetical protein
MPKIPQEFMGRIITTLAITNRLDEGIAERGLMAHDEVLLHWMMSSSIQAQQPFVYPPTLLSSLA